MVIFSPFCKVITIGLSFGYAEPTLENSYLPLAPSSPKLVNRPVFMVFPSGAIIATERASLAIVASNRKAAVPESLVIGFHKKPKRFSNGTLGSNKFKVPFEFISN
jgi:hypothetical protein